jgi:uncharacterized OsmC-like protein
MTSEPKVATFDVVFEAEGRNTGKFRNDIAVHMRGASPVTVDLPSDEGPYHGGDGTAPYPLAYFASGLTACIMTQLRAFSRRLRIDVATISVNTRMEWRATQIGAAPYESAPAGFTLDIDLTGAATDADKVRLIEAAAKGCFIEVALKPGIVRHRLKTAGGWVEV